MVAALRARDLLLKRGDRHHHLENGAGREFGERRPVLQGVAGIPIHGVPGVLREPPGEDVRVEGRPRDHGQHGTRARIEEHGRPGFVAVGLLQGALQIEVESQPQGVSGSGPAPLVDLLDLPAQAVDHRLLPPFDAFELHVVASLDPGLADDLSEVVAELRMVLDVLLAGLADVSQEVGRERSVQVVSPRLDLDRKLRQLEAARLDVGGLRQVHVFLQDHRCQALRLR